MEQTSYWMWTRNKLVAERVPSAAHVNQEYSWEEQAFAEDSAGPLGGCIWPPRSYTCSFCRREFRSAQALGGHMNVHRRDRARLKQSPTTPPPPPHPPLLPPPRHENNIILQNPARRDSLVYIPPPLIMNNPNLVVASSSANRISAASSTQENCSSSSTKHSTLVSPSYTSSIVHNESLFSTPTLTRSEPSITTARFLIVSDSSKPLEQEDKKLRERETTAARILRRVHDHNLNSAVMSSLNLVSRGGRNKPTGSDDDDDDDQGMISNKRRKTSTDTPSTLPFFLKANFIDRRDRLKSEGIELINNYKQSSSVEDELDLELRLGDQPKASNHLKSFPIKACCRSR